MLLQVGTQIGSGTSFTTQFFHNLWLIMLKLVTPVRVQEFLCRQLSMILLLLLSLLMLQRCGAGSIDLTAADTATIFWYDAAAGGTLLNTGATFTTRLSQVQLLIMLKPRTLCPSPRIPVNAIITTAPSDPVVVKFRDVEMVLLH